MKRPELTSAAGIQMEEIAATKAPAMATGAGVQPRIGQDEVRLVGTGASRGDGNTGATMRNGRIFCGSIALAITLTLAQPASHAAAQCTPVTGENPQPGACICVMGPVSVEAQACEITSQELGERRSDYVEWRDSGGIIYTVILITPKRPRSFKGYLGRWRHSHKCTASERQDGPPSQVLDKAGASIPQQITWGGVCAGGDSYIARAVAAGTQVVEMHVARRMGVPKGPSEVEKLFPGLIERVRLSQPPRR